MGFLSPWFLGAAALAGLPVWLHLLRQHKTTPVHFSSLMFFEKRTTTSTRQRRLRYYALLAMRLLALLLLILAFARPYWERKIAAGSGKRMTVAAIDNSFSLRRGNALDAAKEQALGLAGKVSGAEPGIVVAFGASAHEIGQKADDAATFRNHVQAVAAGDSRTSYAELSRVLRGLAEAHRMPLDVHVYTDLQRSGMPARFADLQLPADTKIEIHDVAPKELTNYTVEAVTPPGRIFDTAKARVRATIAALHAPKATKQVSLVADGKVLATKPVDIPENGRASVEFTGLDTGYGFHRGEVRLENAGDTFPGDDVFRFAIERSDPRKVLYLHSGRDSRSALYVKAALDAAVPNAYAIETAAYETTSSPNLNNVSFVMLADPGTLPPSLENALKDYVQKGGALWIAAGGFTGALPKLPVSGLAVKESRMASRSREMFQSVAAKEPLHPVMERTAGIESVKFYQVVAIDPGASAKVLAKTADAAPVVIEQPMGEGRILILASPLDNLGNNLPLHPAFVPLLERAAQYLSRQQESTGIVAVGEGVELRAASDRAIGVEVLDPRGERALTLEQAAKATSFAPQTEGYYEIRRGNGRASLVAVNADRRESDFTRMEDETVALWKATGEPGETQRVNASGERTETVSPWWWLLLAVLGLTVAEGVAASQYLYGSGEGAPSPAELASKEAA
ncbi:MAG TPA: BatA domain-containing protein [Bryobacteraceae bacterium]|nr:BatA domain-containing protein [Bryobacteraceae bacterium]